MDYARKVNIASIGLGAGSGAAALESRAKALASTHIDKEGAYQEIREKRYQQLSALLKKPVAEIVDINREYPADTQAYKSEIKEINKEFFTEREKIRHKRHIDQFPGAWNKLNASEKLRAGGFATVIGVGVGAATYIIGHSLANSGKSTGGDNTAGYYGGGDGGHCHDGGGFGGFGGCGGGGGSGCSM